MEGQDLCWTLCGFRSMTVGSPPWTHEAELCFQEKILREYSVFDSRESIRLQHILLSCSSFINRSTAEAADVDRSALFEATHRTYRCQRSCRCLCEPLPREHSKAEDTGSCTHLLEVGDACPSPTLTAGCPAENRARETTPTLPSSSALPDATWPQGVVPTCRVQNTPQRRETHTGTTGQLRE